MERAFPFARILRMRGQVRQIREAEAEAIATRREAYESGRRSARERRGEVMAERARDIAAGTIDEVSFAITTAYERALAATEEQLARKRDQAESDLIEKRAELRRERVEERKLEHLEERHRRGIEEMRARAGDVLLDELALRAHGRKGGMHGSSS